MAASLTLGGKPLQSARLRRRAADPRRPPLWLGLPALALLLPFLAAIACVLRFSLSQEQQFVSGWTLEHYAALTDPFLLRSALLTLQLALASTVLCLVLAVPIALLMASVDKPIWRRTLTCLVLLPMILNLLIQSYGWIMVLGPAGRACGGISSHQGWALMASNSASAQLRSPWRQPPVRSIAGAGPIARSAKSASRVSFAST